jgi:hypothetical protein
MYNNQIRSFVPIKWRLGALLAVPRELQFEDLVELRVYAKLANEDTEYQIQVWNLSKIQEI